MFVKFKETQTVTALNKKVYILSEMILNWLPTDEGCYPVMARALVKNDRNEYYVAEYSETSWIQSEGGWNMIHVPTVRVMGEGKATGKEAVDSFLERMGERLAPLQTEA